MSDQQQEHPAYYAVIPAKVRYDKRLTANAKLLYGEITALCSKEGYCWASNTYFAALYEVDRSSITKWIKALSEAGYVRTEFVYAQGKPNIETRKIYLAEAVPVPKNPVSKDAADDASEGGGEIIHQGGGEKFHQGGEKTPERLVHLSTTNLNSAAAASDPETFEKPKKSENRPPGESPAATAAAAEFDFRELKETLKALDSRLVFDEPFYKKAGRFLSQNGFDSGYLSFLLEFCLKKNPGSLAGYFFRVFFEPRFAELFRDRLGEEAKPPPSERPVPCPVCGTQHKRNEACPSCGLIPEYFDSPPAVERHKKLSAMSPAEREAYEAETEEVYRMECRSGASRDEQFRRLKEINARYGIP